MEEKFMSIGELSKRMGVTVRTIQYYDKEGLLAPSALSEGGRRLYSSKDMIKLHQILSFKYLGFSLEEIKSRLFSFETPEQVAQALAGQQLVLEEQLKTLQEALQAVKLLRNEVTAIEKVDFNKYAQIIELLRRDCKDYWIWKYFDGSLSDHVLEHFRNAPKLSEQISQAYEELLNEALILKRQNESPESDKSMDFAARWWNMVTDFTKGDMSLLPKLMEYNNDKTHWKKDVAVKQQEADTYVGQCLYHYFLKNGIEIPNTD